MPLFAHFDAGSRYNDKRFEDLKGYMSVPLIQGCVKPQPLASAPRLAAPPARETVCRFERVPGVHHKGYFAEAAARAACFFETVAPQKGWD